MPGSPEPACMSRMDVTTWTLHPESPAEFDAEADTAARRWFHTYWITSCCGIVIMLILLFGVLPPLDDLSLATWVVLLAAVGGVAGFVQYGRQRHRSLRARTGVPVIPELQDFLGHTAQLLASHEAMFHSFDELEFADEYTRSQAREAAEGGLRTGRELAKGLTLHCEVAALAHRNGWNRMRAAKIRQITEALGRLTPAQPQAQEPQDE